MRNFRQNQKKNVKFQQNFRQNIRLHCTALYNAVWSEHGEITVTMSLIIREVHVQHKIVFIQLWGTKVVQNILQRQQQQNNTRKPMNMINRKPKDIQLTSRFNLQIHEKTCNSCQDSFLKIRLMTYWVNVLLYNLSKKKKKNTWATS